MTLEQIKMLKHMIGLSVNKIKKGIYKPFRNYYTAPIYDNTPSLIENIEDDYIYFHKRDEKAQMDEFKITPRGVRLLEQIFDCKIIFEEE